MVTPRIRLGWCVAAIATAAGLAAAEPAWRPLFNGRDLIGWETFLTKPDPTWQVPGLRRDQDGKYLEPIGKDQPADRGGGGLLPRD